MPRRTTCLYCEANGVTTRLVPGGGTLSCPVHSADFLKRSGVPEGYVLLRKVTSSELAQGRPKSRPLV